MFNTYGDSPGCYGDLNTESYTQNVDGGDKANSATGQGLSVWNMHASGATAHTASHSTQSGSSSIPLTSSQYHSVFHHHPGGSAVNSYGYSVAQVPHKETESASGKGLLRSPPPRPPSLAAWQNDRSRSRYPEAMAGGAFLPYQTQLNHYDGPPLDAGPHGISHGGHAAQNHPLGRKQSWAGESPFAGTPGGTQYQRESSPHIYGDNVRGNVPGGIIRHTTRVTGIGARNSPTQLHQSVQQHMHSHQQPLLSHQQTHPLPHHQLFSQLVQQEREAQRLPGYQDSVRQPVLRNRITGYSESLFPQHQQFCNPQDVLRKGSHPIPGEEDRRSAFTARQATPHNQSNWNKNAVPFLPFHHSQMLPNRGAGSAFQPCNKMGESEMYRPNDIMWPKTSQIDHGSHLQISGRSPWMHDPQSQMFLSRQMTKQNLMNNGASVIDLDTDQMNAHCVIQTSALSQDSANRNAVKGHNIPVAYQHHLNLQGSHLQNQIMHSQQVQPTPAVQQPSILSQHQSSPMSNSTLSPMVTSRPGSIQSPHVSNSCPQQQPPQHILQQLQQQQGDSQLIPEEAKEKEDRGTRRSLRNCLDVREFLENWDEDDDVGTPRPYIPDTEAVDNNVDQPLDTTELVVLDCRNLQREEAANLISTMYSGVNLNSVPGSENLIACSSEEMFSSSTDNVVQGDLQNLLDSCGTSSGNSSTTIASPVQSPTGQNGARNLDLLLSSVLPTPPASQEQNVLQTNIPQSSPVTVVDFSSPAPSELRESDLPKLDANGFGLLSPTSPDSSLKFTGATVNTPFVKFPPTEDPISVIQCNKDNLGFNVPEQHGREDNATTLSTPEKNQSVVTIPDELITSRPDVLRASIIADHNLDSSPLRSDTDSKMAATPRTYEKRVNESPIFGRNDHQIFDPHSLDASDVHSSNQKSTNSLITSSTSDSGGVDRSKWAFAQISEHARVFSHSGSSVLKTTHNWEVTEFSRISHLKEKGQKISDYLMVDKGTAPLDCGLESRKSDSSKFDKSTSPTVFLTSKDTQTDETQNSRRDSLCLLNDSFAQTSVRCIQDEIHNDLCTETSVHCVQDKICNDSYARTSVQSLQSEVNNITSEEILSDLAGKTEISAPFENLSAEKDLDLKTIRPHPEKHCVVTPSMEDIVHLGSQNEAYLGNSPTCKHNSNVLDLRIDTYPRGSLAMGPRIDINSQSDKNSDNHSENVGIQNEVDSKEESCCENIAIQNIPLPDDIPTESNYNSPLLEHTFSSQRQVSGNNAKEEESCPNNLKKDHSKLSNIKGEAVKKSESRNRSVGTGTEDMYLSRIVDSTPGNIPKILLSRLKEKSKQNGVIKRLPSIRLTRVSSPMSSSGSEPEYVCSVSDANVGTAASIDATVVDHKSSDLNCVQNRSSFSDKGKCEKCYRKLLVCHLNVQSKESQDFQEKCCHCLNTQETLKESAHENQDSCIQSVCSVPSCNCYVVEKNTDIQTISLQDCKNKPQETESDGSESNVGHSVVEEQSAQDSKTVNNLFPENNKTSTITRSETPLTAEIQLVQENMPKSMGREENGTDPLNILSCIEEQPSYIECVSNQERILTTINDVTCTQGERAVQTGGNDLKTDFPLGQEMSSSLGSEPVYFPPPSTVLVDHLNTQDEPVTDSKEISETSPILENGDFEFGLTEVVDAADFLSQRNDKVSDLADKENLVLQPEEEKQAFCSRLLTSNNTVKTVGYLENLSENCCDVYSSMACGTLHIEEIASLQDPKSSNEIALSASADRNECESTKQSTITSLKKMEDPLPKTSLIEASVLSRTNIIFYQLHKNQHFLTKNTDSEEKICEATIKTTLFEESTENSRVKVFPDDKSVVMEVSSRSSNSTNSITEIENYDKTVNSEILICKSQSKPSLHNNLECLPETETHPLNLTNTEKLLDSNVNFQNCPKSGICDDQDLDPSFRKLGETESGTMSLQPNLLHQPEIKSLENKLGLKTSELLLRSQSLVLGMNSSVDGSNGNKKGAHNFELHLEMSDKDFRDNSTTASSEHFLKDSESYKFSPFNQKEEELEGKGFLMDRRTETSFPASVVDETIVRQMCLESVDDQLCMGSKIEANQDQTTPKSYSILPAIQKFQNLEDIPLPGEVPKLKVYQSPTRHIGMQAQEDTEVSTTDKDTESNSDDSFSLSDEERAFPDPLKPDFDVSRIPLPNECAAIKSRILKARNRKRHSDQSNISETKSKLIKCDPSPGRREEVKCSRTSRKLSSSLFQCSKPAPFRTQCDLMSRSSQTRKIKIKLLSHKQDACQFQSHDNQTHLEVVQEISEVLNDGESEVNGCQKVVDDKQRYLSVSPYHKRDLQNKSDVNHLKIISNEKFETFHNIEREICSNMSLMGAEEDKMSAALATDSGKDSTVISTPLTNDMCNVIVDSQPETTSKNCYVSASLHENEKSVLSCSTPECETNCSAEMDVLLDSTHHSSLKPLQDIHSKPFEIPILNPCISSKTSLMKQKVENEPLCAPLKDAMKTLNIIEEDLSLELDTKATETGIAKAVSDIFSMQGTKDIINKSSDGLKEVLPDDNDVCVKISPPQDRGLSVCSFSEARTDAVLDLIGSPVIELVGSVPEESLCRRKKSSEGCLTDCMVQSCVPFHTNLDKTGILDDNFDSEKGIQTMAVIEEKTGLCDDQDQPSDLRELKCILPHEEEEKQSIVLCEKRDETTNIASGGTNTSCVAEDSEISLLDTCKKDEEEKRTYDRRVDRRSASSGHDVDEVHVPVEKLPPERQANYPLDGENDSGRVECSTQCSIQKEPSNHEEMDPLKPTTDCSDLSASRSPRDESGEGEPSYHVVRQDSSEDDLPPLDAPGLETAQLAADSDSDLEMPSLEPEGGGSAAVAGEAERGGQASEETRAPFVFSATSTPLAPRKEMQPMRPSSAGDDGLESDSSSCDSVRKRRRRHKHGGGSPVDGESDLPDDDRDSKQPEATDVGDEPAVVPTGAEESVAEAKFVEPHSSVADAVETVVLNDVDVVPVESKDVVVSGEVAEVSDPVQVEASLTEAVETEATTSGVVETMKPGVVEVGATVSESMDISASAGAAEVAKIDATEVRQFGDVEAAELTVDGAKRIESGARADEVATIADLSQTCSVELTAELTEESDAEATQADSCEPAGCLEISDIRSMTDQLSEWSGGGGEVVPVPVESINNWPYVEEVLSSEVADDLEEVWRGHDDDLGADTVENNPKAFTAEEDLQSDTAENGLETDNAETPDGESSELRPRLRCSLSWDRVLQEGEGLVLGPAKTEVRFSDRLSQSPEYSAGHDYPRGNRNRNAGREDGLWDPSVESASFNSCHEENNNHLTADAMSPASKVSLRSPSPPCSPPDFSREQTDHYRRDCLDIGLGPKTKGELKSYQVERSRGHRGSRSSRHARGRRGWYSQLSPGGSASASSWRSPGPASADGEVPRVIIKRGPLTDAARVDWRMQPVVMVTRDAKLDARAARVARREQRSLRGQRHGRKRDRHDHDRIRSRDRVQSCSRDHDRVRDRDQRSPFKELGVSTQCLEEQGRGLVEFGSDMGVKRRRVSCSDRQHRDKGAHLHVMELVRRWRQADATPTGEETPMPAPLSPGLDPTSMSLAQCPSPELGDWRRLLEAPSPLMSVSGEAAPPAEDIPTLHGAERGAEDGLQFYQCEACGMELSGDASAERANHIKLHPYHCQRCYQAFASQGDFMQHLKAAHPNTQELHHCLLCLETFPTERQHAEHKKGWSHCHMERSQRRTIHTLFRMFTGSDCPRLAHLTPEDMQALDWLPNDSGVIHFYHQATPLQLATEEWHLHHGNTSGRSEGRDSAPVD